MVRRMPDNAEALRHTTERQAAGFESPLWLVGSSPFDTVKTADEGHVVHLGEPRFVARWFHGDQPVNPTDATSGIVYRDADHGVTVCEVVLFERSLTAFEAWLYEAVAVIALWRGLGETAPRPSP